MNNYLKYQWLITTETFKATWAFIKSNSLYNISIIFSIAIISYIITPLQNHSSFLNSVAISLGAEISLIFLILLSQGFITPYKLWKNQKKFINDYSNHCSSLILLKPIYRYSMVWDPLKDLTIITSPILKNEQDNLEYRLPIFRLKNLGSNVIRNIEIEWSINDNLLDNNIMQCCKFKPYNTSFDGKFISMEKQVSNKKKSAIGQPINFNTKTFHDYLAPQIDNTSYLDINVPSSLYAALEYFFVASTKESLSIFSPGILQRINLSISYEEKNKKRNEKYSIDVIAHNTKPSSTDLTKISFKGEWREPPEVMAEVSFNIEQA